MRLRPSLALGCAGSHGACLARDIPEDAECDLAGRWLVTDEVPDDGTRNGQPIPEAPGLQTHNPGWPGFSSGGWVASGGIYLEVAL